MKLSTAKFIVEMTEGTENECQLYEDYSGRGMFGDTTTGVTAQCGPAELLGTVLASIFATPQFETDDYPDIDYSDFEGIKSDSMGRGTIIY